MAVELACEYCFPESARLAPTAWYYVSHLAVVQLLLPGAGVVDMLSTERERDS
jgi:hypothetical protein